MNNSVNNNKSNNGIKINATGCFVLIWFLIGFSIIGTLGSINSNFAVIGAGQIFMLPFILFIKGKMGKGFSSGTICLLLLLISAMLLFSGVTRLFRLEEFASSVEQKYPLFFALFLIYAGLGAILSYFVNKSRKKKRCTQVVTATVVDLERRVDSDSSATYAPIYRFSFNGNDYTVVTSSSRNFLLPQIGSQKQMFINPASPMDYYVPSTKRTVFVLIFGVLMLYFALRIFMLYGLFS